MLGRCPLVRHDDVVDLREGVAVDDSFLAEFAARHGIRRLALCGSALRADFGPASDVDLLVEFRPERTPGLLELAQMELELEAAIGRRVDLRTYEDLSRHIRDQVAVTARPPMRPDDRVRPRHLAEAATKAIAYSEDRLRTDLDDDELPRLALTKLVEIVALAGRRLIDAGGAPVVRGDARQSPARTCSSSSRTAPAWT